MILNCKFNIINFMNIKLAKPVTGTMNPQPGKKVGTVGDSRLWEASDYPPDELIAMFKECQELKEAYLKQYQFTKERLETMPKAKQFDKVDKMAEAFIDDDEWNYYKDKGFTDKTDLFVEKRKQIPEFNEQVLHNVMNYGDVGIKGTQDSFFGGTYDRAPTGHHFADGGIASLLKKK